MPGNSGSQKPEARNQKTGPRPRLTAGRRRNLYIEDEQWDAITEAADAAGISSSELIRRAIAERLPEER